LPASTNSNNNNSRIRSLVLSYGSSSEKILKVILHHFSCKSFIECEDKLLQRVNGWMDDRQKIGEFSCEMKIFNFLSFPSYSVDYL
jgi:hypothetical protein